MASYKVTYFQARGGGEIIRLTLTAAGQEFEDERLTREQWQEFKPKTPMKAMPLLTIKDGGKETVFCQSGSISKYIAKKFGLYGDNDVESLYIDEVYESIQDSLRDLYKGFFAPTEELKKEAMQKFISESVPKIAEYFDKRKGELGKNGYIIGSKLTLADLAFFNFVDGVSKMNQLKDLWKDYAAIKAHSELVKSNAKIAAWLAKRPESEF